MLPMKRLHTVVVDVNDNWILNNDLRYGWLLWVLTSILILYSFSLKLLTLKHFTRCLLQFGVEIDGGLWLGCEGASVYFGLVVHGVF